MSASPSSRVLMLTVLGAGLAAGCGGKSSHYPDPVTTGSGGGAARSGGATGSGGSGTGTGGMGTSSGGATATGGAIAPGEPVPIAAFGAEYLAASCALSARCGAYPDVASCLATNQVGSGVLTLAADVASGRVTYDPVKGAACTASIRNAPCTTTAAVAKQVEPSPCAGAFVGTVAAGQPCFVSGECVAGAACTLTAACSMACCAGTCTAPVATGQSCASAPCMAGQYCRQTGQSTFKCTPKGTAEGAPCDAGDACVAPLFCAPDPGGMTGSCVKSLPATGAACNPFAGCDDDLQEYCNAQGVCAKRVGVGQACLTTTMPAGDNCVWWAYCAGGTCKAFGSAGATCQTDANGVSDCLGGQICQTPGMTCAAAPAAVSCR